MKQNRIWGMFALVATTVMLWGCPYSSNFALSDTYKPVDKFLVGNWIEEYAGEGEYIGISLKENNKLLIEKHGSDGVTTYTGGVSSLGGHTFLNVYDEGMSSYYYYEIKLDKTAGTVTLTEVSEYIDEKFDTAEALRLFFTENAKNSYFFTTDHVYTKKAN